MKIGIVHHLNEQRERLRSVIHELTDHLVVWTTNYGRHAIELSEKERPDLILLDVHITELDGILVAKDLMSRTNCPILLITHDIGKNSSLIFEAMAHGALDVAVIPEKGTSPQYSSMIQKITQFSFLVEPEKVKNVLPDTGRKETGASKCIPLIAIGASTGGPLAIASIISSFPTNLEAAVVIIQHVDDKFTSDLVEWFSKRSHLPVHLIEKETKPKSGSRLCFGLQVASDGDKRGQPCLHIAK